MAIPALPDRRTQAEKDAYNQRDYDELWFEAGRTYMWDLATHWVGGFGFYRREDWTVYIRQAECPWMIVASQSFPYRRTILGIPKGVQRARAVQWANAYMKRGGPPDDHWKKTMYEEQGYTRS